MKRILGALGAAAVLVLAVPQSATAGVDTVGWFTRNPAASAPEGGIQVANAPDGVVSYGAISITEAGDTITRATLTMVEEGQGLNAAGAALRACPAAGSFTSGQGEMAAGPKADCTVGSVDLTRDGEGVWTADVTSVLSGDDAALAVVPAEGAGVFQVSFAAPDLAVEADASSGGSGIDSSFDASEFGGTSGGGDSSSSFEEFSGSSGSGSTFDSSSSGSFDSTAGGSTFDASSFSAAPATTVAAPAEAPPAAEVAASPELVEGSAMPTRRNLAGTAAASTEGGSGKQFVFFVLTAAVIGTGAGVGRNRLVTAKGA